MGSLEEITPNDDDRGGPGVSEVLHFVDFFWSNAIISY
jgi:hypothetical protein